MQDVDIPALVWAVRREIDIHLADRPETEDEEKAWLASLVQIADVTAVDGHRHLLAELCRGLHTDARAPGKACPRVLGILLGKCLDEPALRSAVTGALSISPLDPASLFELATSLTTDQRVRLGLVVLTSGDSAWEPEGAALLDHLLQAAVAREVSVSPTLLHAAYTQVHATSLSLTVPEAALRRLLADTYAKQPAAAAVLRPFASASQPPSAAAAASGCSTAPSPSKHLAEAHRSAPGIHATDAASQGAVADLRTLGSLVSHRLDVGLVLADAATLGAMALAGALREAGPGCSHWPQSLASVLASFPTASPPELAAAIAVVTSTAGQAALAASSQGDPSLQWNVDAVTRALLAQYPAAAWDVVFAAMDCDVFVIPDEPGFAALMAFWAALGGGPFPIEAFVSQVWRNLKGQLSFLRFAVYQPPSTIDFARLESTIKPLDLGRVEPDVLLANSLANHAWYCLDVLRVLVAASEQGDELLTPVLQILEAPTRRIPEVLVVGFGSLPVPTDNPAAGPRLPRQVIASMGPPLVGAPLVGQQVLARLCKKNFPMLMMLLQSTYNDDPASITNILNAVQELKIMQGMLESKDYIFALDLAVLAHRREFLNLEKWLPGLVASDPDGVITALATFLHTKLELPAGSAHVPLEPGSLAQIVQVIAALAPGMTNGQKLQLQPVLHRAQKEQPSGALNAACEQVVVKWPKATEKRADAMFNELYEKGEEGVMDMVERMRDMVQGADIDIAEYMIQDIFEEYPFFGKYPEDKLRTTAAFIGQLLANNVLVNRSMLVSMKMVLECLQAPPDKAKPTEVPHVRLFALHALRFMTPMLKSHPSYCERMLACKDALAAEPALLQHIVGIVTEFRAGRLAAPAPPGLPAPLTAPGDPARAPAPAPAGAFGQGNTTLAAAQDTYASPGPKVIDRVAFLLNNLSDANLRRTADELAAAVAEPHHLWFAHYLVNQRAAQEQNFQHVYVQLLEAMGQRALFKAVLRVTYQGVAYILQGDKLSADSSSRVMLKALGSWVGKLTIGRNYPVMRRELDVKAIIVDAYQRGHLIAVFPFVLRLLQEGPGSKVFNTARNPWVRAVLALMKEVYSMDNLKMALKFDVEKALQTFGVSAAMLPTTALLPGVPRVQGDANPDFKGWAPEAERLAADRRGKADAGGDDEPRYAALDAGDGLVGLPPGMPGPGAPLTQAQPRSAAPASSNLLAQLHSLVCIPPELSQYKDRWQLEQMVPAAVDRAVGEIMMAAVERSVTIACMTTKELVLKDFANDPDEARLRQSAHHMASALAGSLALVTCREALQTGLMNHMKQYLKSYAGGSDPRLVDEAAALLVARNHHVGCTFIEQAAMDKAIQDVEEHLVQSYDARRAHVAGTPSSAPFLDINASVHSQHALPAMLQLRPGAPTAHQQAVYEHFPRMSRAGPDPRLLEERFGQWLKSLDKWVAANPTLAYHTAVEEPHQKALVDEVLQLVSDFKGPEVAESIALQLFRHMWDSPPTRYGVTLSLIIVDLLLKQHSAQSSRAFITATWLALPEGKKWTMGFIETLLRLHMLDFAEVDAALAALVTARAAAPAVPDAPPHMEVVESFVRKFIVEEDAFFVHDLQATIAAVYGAVPAPGSAAARARVLALVDDALKKGGLVVGGGPGAGVAAVVDPRMSFLEDMQALSPQASGALYQNAVAQRQQVASVLDAWSAECEKEGGNPSAELSANFVKRMQSNGLLSDANTPIVLRLALDLLLVHAYQHACLPPPTVNLATLDAYVLLLTAIARKHERPAEFVKLVLSTAASLCIDVARRRKSAFQPRPFFRFFIGLLNELPLAEDPVPPHVGLTLFAQTLKSLEPKIVPAFAFCWLELLAHRNFMVPLLSAPKQVGHGMYHNLLCMVLSFLEPALRDGDLSEPIKGLYKGVLRVLLVLLHDFPEVLSSYHVTLCHHIAPRCLQMRNLVLSAFPAGMRLPDPFTPNLKVDQLPEMAQDPALEVPSFESLLGRQLLIDLDAFLAAPAGEAGKAFLAALPARLREPTVGEPGVPGQRYAVPVMTGLVLYMAIADMHRNGRGVATKTTAPAYAVLSHLARSLDNEGLYLLFSTMTNQLRFPSSHTHYFSCTLLQLFADCSKEATVREICTRVLLERVMAARPHPWGIVVTFVELIKNPRYSFWHHDFLNCAPEIRNVFDSIYRTQGEGGGGAPGLMQALGMQQVTPSPRMGAAA